MPNISPFDTVSYVTWRCLKFIYCNTIHAYDLCRYTNDSGTIGNIVGYNGVGADPYIRADGYTANYFGTRPNVNVITENRALVTFRTDSDTMINNQIASCTDVGVNHDPGAMQNHEARAKFGVPTDGSVCQARIYPINDCGQDFQVMRLAEPHHPVQYMRHASITKHHA